MERITFLLTVAGLLPATGVRVHPLQNIAVRDVRGAALHGKSSSCNKLFDVVFYLQLMRVSMHCRTLQSRKCQRGGSYGKSRSRNKLFDVVFCLQLMRVSMHCRTLQSRNCQRERSSWQEQVMQPAVCYGHLSAADACVHPLQNIAIRETSERQIFVAGAEDEPAGCAQEAVRLLEMGSLSRSTGAAEKKRKKQEKKKSTPFRLEKNPGLMGLMEPSFSVGAAFCFLLSSIPN